MMDMIIAGTSIRFECARRIGRAVTMQELADVHYNVVNEGFISSK